VNGKLTIKKPFASCKGMLQRRLLGTEGKIVGPEGVGGKLKKGRNGVGCAGLLWP